MTCSHIGSIALCAYNEEFVLMCAVKTFLSRTVGMTSGHLARRGLGYGTLRSSKGGIGWTMLKFSESHDRRREESS